MIVLWNLNIFIYVAHDLPKLEHFISGRVVRGFAHPLCSVAMWGQGTTHCHDSFQTHLSAGRKTGNISPRRQEGSEQWQLTMALTNVPHLLLSWGQTYFKRSEAARNVMSDVDPLLIFFVCKLNWHFNQHSVLQSVICLRHLTCTQHGRKPNEGTEAISEVKGGYWRLDKHSPRSIHSPWADPDRYFCPSLSD